MAPKKKVQREVSSDLSDAPADLADAIVKETKPAVARKRKTANGVDGGDQKRTSVKDEPDVKPPAKRQRRATKEVVPKASDHGDGSSDEDSKPVKKAKSPRKKATKSDGNEVVTEKTPVKRKTKEEKEAEMVPLRARNLTSKMIIGAHVSAAGGVGNAVTNSVHLGANAFALFLKSQRKWTNPPLEAEAATIFLEKCAKHGYAQNEHVVPHGSYLVNLAATDAARTKQAYDTFLDDLHRCEKLGIKLYNFHPGNCLKEDRMDAIRHLASNLNRAHRETSTVVTLLENMAAGGNILGSTFEDLKHIIDHVDDKTRVGVCLDTCHAFAGGYDLRTKADLEATLQNFDDVVGLKYLRALHLNDSKAPFKSHRDLHANIGTGFLGLRAFHAIVNEPRFEGLPIVLETPIDVRDDDGVVVKDEKGKDKEDKGIWAGEIEMLEGLVGMDIESEAFRVLEEKLQRKGAPERKRILEQVEKREVKKAKEGAAKGKAKGKKGGKKGKKEESEASELSDLESDV